MKQIFKLTKTMVIPELQYTGRLNLKQWPETLDLNEETMDENG